MSWQKQILDKPEFGIRGMLLVADPDEILHEPKIHQGLVSLGWEMVEYRDPVVFRGLYEAKFRNLLDAKVLVRVQGPDLKVLPYDVWKRGYKLELSIQNLFPKLSYPVLKLVNSELLAKVYAAYQGYDSGTLGEQATKDFILERVYEIYPRNITSITGLFAGLLHLHYRGFVLPPILADRYVQTLAVKTGGLNVKMLAESRESFFRYLQEEWGKYLAGEDCLVPFDDSSIRVYVDSLFLEGILQPKPSNRTDLPAWARVGVVESRVSDEQLILIKAKLAETVSDANNYRQWQSVCRLLAEALYWTHRLEQPLDELETLRCAAEERFFSWLQQAYGGLSSLSFYSGPVMVHHIPWFLDAERHRGRDKVALLVIDGMAMDQWLVVKEGLKDFTGQISESACFAWVPTTTAISRQAMFAGEIPANIADYLKNTSREEKLWHMFWGNQQLNKRHVFYAKTLGQGNPEEVIASIDSRTKVAGLIIDTVDKLMHGEILGARGLHSQLRLWLSDGYLTNLIDGLTDEGFHVYITSDHGNVVATGGGRPKEGVFVEDAGERVRIYSSQELQHQGEIGSNSVSWPSVGLPEEMHVLLAKGKTAFVQEGKAVIGHGGASITEVIVPFIHLWKEE